MDNKDLGRSVPDGLSSLCDPAPTGLARPASIPSADVSHVFRDMEARFGPGISNGVAAILLHDNLPPRFGMKQWNDWQFKPALGAFSWAHDRGLIVPWKLSNDWCFTILGKAASEELQAAQGMKTRRAETLAAPSRSDDSPMPQACAQGDPA